MTAARERRAGWKCPCKFVCVVSVVVLQWFPPHSVDPNIPCAPLPLKGRHRSLVGTGPGPSGTRRRRRWWWWCVAEGVLLTFLADGAVECKFVQAHTGEHMRRSSARSSSSSSSSLFSLQQLLLLPPLLRATTDTTALPNEFQSHLSQSPSLPGSPALIDPRGPASVLRQTAAPAPATVCAGAGMIDKGWNCSCVHGASPSSDSGTPNTLTKYLWHNSFPGVTRSCQRHSAPT